MYKVDNAVIMAAGTSSRFAPLSYEKPKALIEVRGEVLIERQIRQLREAGVSDIYIVTGYKSEDFQYLTEKYGVILRHNASYNTRNNHSSIYQVRDILKNSYICSADNYFTVNPFTSEAEDSYYSALYADGETKEWCMKVDEDDYITEVSVGGENSWYMLGHVFWNEEYSEGFVRILEAEYDNPETIDKLWEDIYLDHIDELKMKINRYGEDEIYEFDTLDELREFDNSYVSDTRSRIIENLAEQLGVDQSELYGFKCIKGDGNEAIGVRFKCRDDEFEYQYDSAELMKSDGGF